MEWLAQLDPRALVVGAALLALLLALPFFGASVRRLRRLKLIRGTVFLLLAGVFVLVAALLGLVAANLYTYARLTHEEQAARVTMRQLGEQHYAVRLHSAKTSPKDYSVRGDEWQIDARLLKWRPLGNLLGLDTVYRLERLSGRYGDIGLEQTAPRTVYALSEEPGLDVWSLVRRHHRYLPFADALYGSAAYVPMAEGAEYVLSVSTSGLVVRPANDAARDALGRWK